MTHRVHLSRFPLIIEPGALRIIALIIRIVGVAGPVPSAERHPDTRRDVRRGDTLILVVVLAILDDIGRHVTDEEVIFRGLHDLLAVTVVDTFHLAIDAHAAVGITGAALVVERCLVRHSFTQDDTIGVGDIHVLTLLVLTLHDVAGREIRVGIVCFHIVAVPPHGRIRLVEGEGGQVARISVEERCRSHHRLRVDGSRMGPRQRVGDRIDEARLEAQAMDTHATIIRIDIIGMTGKQRLRELHLGDIVRFRLIRIFDVTDGLLLFSTGIYDDIVASSRLIRIILEVTVDIQPAVRDSLNLQEATAVRQVVVPERPGIGCDRHLLQLIILLICPVFVIVGTVELFVV